MVKTRGQQKLELGFQPERTATRSQVQTVQNARQRTTLQVRESDEDIEDSRGENENESDYGTTATGCTPKRRKRAWALCKSLGKRTGEWFDLFFAMPLDIVFEVAGYLAPQDLLALSWTSKALWRTLHSQNALSVWKAVRSGVGAPDCSPGFSEPRWAFLLFGRPVCGACGTTNVHNVEFGIRRRVCTRCKRQHLVSAARFKTVFPMYDSLVMDMVPHTPIGGWKQSHSPRSPSKYFWQSDVERVVSEWAALQRDIQMHVKDARATASAYRKQRIDEVERIAQHAKLCNDWLHQVNRELRHETQEKRISRFDAIREQLLALGYNNRDIHYSMFNRPSFMKDVEFTDEFWAHIQAKAVALVEENRDDRLKRERATLRVARLNILQSLYTEYAKSLAPLQWCYLPNIYQVADIPIFKDIVDADSSVIISRQSFLPATEQFSTLIPEWISAKKEGLISMLPPPSRTVDHPLGLATAVFVCTSQICHNSSLSWGNKRTQLALISWEAVAAHSCQAIGDYLIASHNPTNVGASQLGMSTASSLVRLTNLNPSSTTIVEMDALDLRFACLQCPLLIPGRNFVEGYSWRSAVEHSMTTEHTNWYKMTLEETQSIKQSERDSRDGTAAWSCNRCTYYFGRWRTKPEIVHHLSETHQITSPTEPSDLFWYPGKHRTLYVMTTLTEIVVPVPQDVV